MKIRSNPTGVRSALILGGSSGIGRACFDLLEARNFAGFRQVHAYGREDFDAASRASMQAVIRDQSPTDVIFSVGVNYLDWTRDVTLDNFSEVMDTNVYAFLNLIRVLQEELSRPVNVVAVTSDAAWRPMRTSAVYCASKAALEMAVRVASRELAPDGWRVNAVAPGKVAETPMTEYVDARVLALRGWTEEFAKEYERQSSPIGRMVTKAEVAGVILDVLDGPPAQTGEIVAVNGGR